MGGALGGQGPHGTEAQASARPPASLPASHQVIMDFTSSRPAHISPAMPLRPQLPLKRAGGCSSCSSSSSSSSSKEGWASGWCSHRAGCP